MTPNEFPRLIALNSERPERRGHRESCLFIAEETDDFDSVRPDEAEAKLKVITERDLFWGFAKGTRPWWFKTHDGAKGVLQILGTADSPRGLKIRYKLVQQSVGSALVWGASVGQAPPFATPSFSPVIERKIPLSGACLKLAAGELMPLRDRPGAQDVRKAGGDLFWASTQSGIETLRGVDLYLLEVGEPAWTNLSATALEEEQAQDGAARKLHMGEQLVGPGVYALKGRGLAGLLEVSRQDPKAGGTSGVNVRYKLVQTATKWLGAGPGLEITGPAIGFTQAQMRAWVEKRLASEYPHDKYWPLEWGEPESVAPHDWVTIRYKHIVSFGHKQNHYYQSHRRYTFTKTGDFVRSDYVDGPEIEVPEPAKPAAATPGAGGATLSEKSQKIVDALLENIDHLVITLEHRPQEQADHHSLHLQTNNTAVIPDFYLRPRVTSEQMKKLLMRLASGGFLDRASGGFHPPQSSLTPETVRNEPGYMLIVRGQEAHKEAQWSGSFHEDLRLRDGAAAKALKQLSLVLEGEAKDSIETILRESSLKDFQLRWVAADGDADSPADLLPDATDRNGLRKLRVLKPVILDGRDVEIAGLIRDSRDPALGKDITVSLKPHGAKKLGEATGKNIGRQLAVVWQGRVINAPFIREAVAGKHFDITYVMMDAEAEHLLFVFNRPRL